jgi:hypothetical protein
MPISVSRKPPSNRGIEGPEPLPFLMLPELTHNRIWDAVKCPVDHGPAHPALPGYFPNREPFATKGGGLVEIHLGLGPVKAGAVLAVQRTALST